MRLHVGVQVRLLVEALITVGELAWEGLFSGVDTLMRLKVEVEGKPLTADLTLVGFLTCVHEHVSLQFGVVQESLLTARVHARIQLVPMHSHVLLETGPVVEDLPTRLQMALEGLGHLLRWVPMGRKGQLRAVGSTAFPAHEHIFA